MWALPQQILKPLPSFIEHLILPLGKSYDLIPLTCHLTRRKKLRKEGLGELIPSSYRSPEVINEAMPMKRKQLESYGIGENATEL